MSITNNTNVDYENQTVRTIGEKLYLDADTADVHFAVKIGNEGGAFERIPGHKSQLAAGSDVFKAMFYGDIKELGDVMVTDISVSGFKEFLQFFYLSRVQLTTENFGEVMNFGQKYIVPECLKIGLIFLKDELTVDNICTIYDVAIALDIKELNKLCENWITVNSEDFFNSDSFLSCSRDLLGHILQLNHFSCSEMDIFVACISWVKGKTASQQDDEITKESIQLHLGNLFYEIRFRSMTLDQFSELVTPFGQLFSGDEIKEIIQMIASDEFRPKLFNEKLRHVEWDEKNIIKCDRISPDNYNSSIYLKTESFLTISTNEPIVLGAFVCSYLKDSQGTGVKISTQITITESSESGVKVLCKMYPCLFEGTEAHIILPTPILIRPGYKYEFSLMQQNERKFYYRNWHTSPIVEMNSGTLISFHNTSYNSNFITTLKFNRL